MAARRNIKGCVAVLLWAPDPQKNGDPSHIVSCNVHDITSSKPNLKEFLKPEERFKDYNLTFKDKEGTYTMRFFARIERGKDSWLIP
jgi:hypothetical protein